MRFPAKVLWLMLWTGCVAQDCVGPPPKKEREILQGSWSDQSYKDGTKATYKCRPGFRTYGVITVQCKEGQWVELNPAKTCQKRPCGHPGDMPFGSFDLAVGDRFEYGAKVVYTCDEGYRMIGEVNFRECEADGWTNDVPLCEVIKCLPVTDPENGRVVSGAFGPDQEYSFGQVIKFECNPGFKLDGPKEIHCSENGAWSAEKPGCVEISCRRPEIPHGEPTSPKNLYKERERLQYKCSRGYSYGERAEATCTQAGWVPHPVCKEVTCDPPTIANSHYIPDRTSYRLGDRITYECKNGFYHTTRGSASQCTDVGWEPPPRCTFKPCEYPEIKHGSLYRAERYREYFPAPVGKWYDYSCDANYVTPTQTYWVRITCTTDGWSPKPLCLRACTFSYLENGRYPWFSETYLQGKSIEVTCYPGYGLPDQQTKMTCTENGWSPPPKCVRVVTCSKSDIEIENGFFSESQLTYPLHKETQYKCKEGYLTEDGQTAGRITCLQRGWSTPHRCIKSCDMPVFENARARSGSTWFKVNDRLDYECQDGYKNRDGHTTGFIVCGPSGWSGSPTCHEKECIAPDIEQNTNVEPRKEKYLIGDVLKFSCRHRGMKLVGPDSIQCYNFGWSPDPPTCKEEVKPCGLHPELPNGKATNAPKEEYEHGQVVEYVCDPGFLLKGSKKIQCVDGEWTALPRCVEENSTCEPTPDIANGSVYSLERPYHHGESVEFSCSDGFTLVGPRSATCLKGKWTQPPECIETGNLKTCKLPRSRDYEPLQSDRGDYDHNEQMNYTCPRRSAQKHSVCVHGRWEPEVNCGETPRCPPPPQIPKSQNMKTTVNYQEGETISVLCQNNSLMLKPEDLVCRGGVWTSVPRCVEKTPCSQPPNVEHGTINSSRPEGPGEDTLAPQLYPHGTELRYVCEDGFRITGNLTISCQLGKWSITPQCEGLPCGPPPPVSNGVPSKKKSRYEYGEELRYSCVSGLSIHGPASVTCSGGKWSPAPECIKTSCPSPPSFNNAKAININRSKKSYKAGYEVAYECAQHHRLDGSNVVRCVAGRWVGTPTCRDNSCGSPPIVENAIIHNKKTRYLPDERVRYECLESLDLFGDGEVTCRNGNWTEPPQCKEAKGKCKPPPTINNGDITTFPSAVYAPGDSVEYKCQAYYKLQGHKTITCRDGEWSEPPKCLEACVVSEEMMEKHKIRLKWRDDQKLYSKTDDTLEFTCQYGYRATSPRSAFRVTCREGKLTYPTCE